MTEQLRIGIAGASGIGRHHAKWYDFWGCDVVAFAGTSLRSCEQTLSDLFGFSGRSYCDLQQLLSEERPAVLDICTPDELHFDCALAALRHGDTQILGTDFMSALIRQFTTAVLGAESAPLVPGMTALKNLSLQLQVLKAAS